MSIDWSKPGDKVSEHFTVRECLYLSKWHRVASELDGVTEETKANLKRLCAMMEKIRTILNCPITIHCIYRSPEYNKLIGGAPKSQHVNGLACDFDCGDNLSMDKIKELLLPKLEELNIRMEDNGSAAGWCHIDLGPVISTRFFKP